MRDGAHYTACPSYCTLPVAAVSASTAAWAIRYIEKYGLALVPIPPGHKAPLHSGWNAPGGFITDAEEARQRWGDLPDHGIGTVLGPSGLCSIDVDSPEHAVPVLGALGIGLDSLRKVTPTIQGNPSRYRLMFRAPPGVALGRKALVWPARQTDERPLTLFELRAGDIQDVLPPTIHPDTRKAYLWESPPNSEFPLLPEPLLELWQHWDSYRKELEGMCPWAKHGFNPGPAPRGAGARPDVIAAFNAGHTVEEMLARHGYKQRGKRWISPTSSSGLAGITILDGRVFSHHASDPLADGHTHDAFDLFRILDHGGDTRSAIKAAAEELGMDSAASSKARWDGAAPGGARVGEEASMAGEDSPRPFPVLSEKAQHGIFKEIVELGTRNSEADPAAVLMTALTFAAAAIGTEPHTWVGDTRHHARLYSVLVGASSRARKGTSRDPVQRIFLEAQRVLRRKPKLPFPFGNDLAITPGPLSSGEGLVYAVRDASDALDKDGQPIDSGVEDKRLLVVDGEFGAALKAAQRQGNTLSAILRSGWDYGNVAPLTKSNRIKASGAHINFIAHITLEELHALLASVDLWNGFANRILWTAVRRTGQVAHPSRIPDKELGEVAEKVATALLTASKRKEMSFTAAAAALWTGIYPDLTPEHSGAFGAVTSRGEAQVRRIALLHAALDTEASAIGVPHLRAATAAWDYCLASARYVFGGAEVDPDANKLLAALGERDMTLTDINGLFSGHKSKGAINALLTRLQSAGRVTLREEGGGRDGRAKTTVTLRK